MASRDLGDSVKAALRDLFDERAVVQDAIDKLQSVLGNVRESVAGKRLSRPQAAERKSAVAAPVKRPRAATKKVTKKKKKVAAAKTKTSGPRSKVASKARKRKSR